VPDGARYRPPDGVTPTGCDLIYIVLAMRFGARLLSADGDLLQLAARIDPSMA